MYSNKIIAQGAMGGTTVAVVSFITNVLKIGYVVDLVLVPFCLMFMKYRNKQLPMKLPLIVASALLFFYKFYLIFFVLCYWALAEATWKWGKGFKLHNILIISLTYALTYYGVWFLVAILIHNYRLSQLVYIFTGFGPDKIGLIIFLLIVEPVIYAFALIMCREKIQRYKL